MHNLLKSVFSVFCPLTCSGCNRESDRVICEECIDTFRPVVTESACPVCGRQTGTDVLCGSCIKNKNTFQQGYFGYYFEGRLRDTIHAFKFNGRTDAGKYLVHLMKERVFLIRNTFDCIIPVPVTAKRLHQRGFNQSFIIGEEIAGITQKPVYPSVLFKTKETKDQFTLSKKERKQNVRGVFSVRRVNQIAGKRVLLVDDLFTTGYTANEATRVLMKASARAVTFFALARTPS